MLLLQMKDLFLRAVRIRPIPMRTTDTRGWGECIIVLSNPVETIKKFFFLSRFCPLGTFCLVYFREVGDHQFQPGADLGFCKPGFASWIFFHLNFSFSICKKGLMTQTGLPQWCGKSKRRGITHPLTLGSGTWASVLSPPL